jgi:methionine synthase II (cobalamin-independent)
MSAKLHQRPPFRAEHLGSLLRPGPLLDVRHALDKGQGSQKELKAIEDTSVDQIVKEQQELGFHSISDGEYRRHMFWLVLDCSF